MTTKLYDINAYAKEFEGVVQSCEKIEKNQMTVYEVILDQTLFFPEEGGQTPDQGTLAGQDVLDVQMKDNIIIHTVKEPIKEGTAVNGKIDWKHRFNNMQQHSGEHIFSGLVHALFGYDNVGFHLSNQVVTMDFNGVLTAEEIENIEYAANNVITRNLPIMISFPSKKDLEKLDYRSKIEIEGQVRIVTIPGVDVCACCAPHVKQTGEVGFLKVTGLQNYKGGVRVNILCGFRALEDFRKKSSVITTLSNSLSTNQDNLIDYVEKLKQQNQDLKHEIIRVKEEYLRAKLQEIPIEQENVYLFEQELSAPVMRNVVNKLVAKHQGICGVFTGTDEEGYRFILGSTKKDTRETMNRLKSLGAKGGGSAEMVQGSVAASREEILSIL